MEQIWSKMPPEIMQEKPYYVALTVVGSNGLKSLKFASPQAAPFMYANSPEELFGNASLRKQIISVVPQNERRLVAGHRVTGDYIFNKSIYLLGEESSVYTFASLKNARDGVLRERFHEVADTITNRDVVVTLDHTVPALCNNTRRVVDCIPLRNNCVWDRKSGEVVDVYKTRIDAPQRSSVDILRAGVSNARTYLARFVNGHEL